MRVNKPWGWYRTIIKLPFFWLKVLYVELGHQTSLQYHRKRSELHIGKMFRYYPKHTIHRMGHGLWIEFAFGAPDEKDIVRLEDDYNRK